jgi:hypothetical protein
MLGHLYGERNTEALARLSALIRRLGDEDLTRALGDGWTVSTALAHVAFWDRFQAARWAQAQAAGLRLPGEIGEVGGDFINDASLESWRATPPRLAAEQALAAAEHIERIVAGLDVDVAEELIAAGRNTLVDRTKHWNEHIAQIEDALSR